MNFVLLIKVCFDNVREISYYYLVCTILNENKTFMNFYTINMYIYLLGGNIWLF